MVRLLVGTALGILINPRKFGRQYLEGTTTVHLIKDATNLNDSSTHPVINVSSRELYTGLPISKSCRTLLSPKFLP